MKITQTTLNQASPCDLLCLLAIENQDMTPILEQINLTDSKLLQRINHRQPNFKAGSSLAVTTPDNFFAKEILFIGLGPLEKVTPLLLQRSLQKAILQNPMPQLKTAAYYLSDIFQDPLNSTTSKNFSLKIPSHEILSYLIESWLLATYRFDTYFTDPHQKAPPAPQSLQIITSQKPLTQDLVFESTTTQAMNIAKAINQSRQLTNLPANQATPTYLAQTAQQIAKEEQLQCQILSTPEIQNQEMNAFLSVSQGSQTPPKLIILKHESQSKNQPTVVLLGKGVTFDTGGISLKPSKNLHHMKDDMAGAAVVISLLQLAAQEKLPLNLIGIIPASENSPDGAASRPGDIIQAKNGKTIEILNTDAEGRLLLADSLTYSQKFSPDIIIDLATLTGSTSIALGSQAASIIGNNQKLIDLIIQASHNTTDRLWQLPLWDEYQNTLTSQAADLANISTLGDREAGAIVAAAFLQNFVPHKSKWAHLDIAAVAYQAAANDYNPPGATGFGVKIIFSFLKKLGQEPDILESTTKHQPQDSNPQEPKNHDKDQPKKHDSERDPLATSQFQITNQQKNISSTSTVPAFSPPPSKALIKSRITQAYNQPVSSQMPSFPKESPQTPTPPKPNQELNQPKNTETPPLKLTKKPLTVIPEPQPTPTITSPTPPPSPTDKNTLPPLPTRKTRKKSKSHYPSPESKESQIQQNQEKQKKPSTITFSSHHLDPQ